MKSSTSFFCILLAVCAVMFWFRLGHVGLIDPDEPFYAQSAHEMVVSGDWIVPQIYGKPQFEKPILYYWLVAGSYRLFGENEFSGRFPSALFGTLLTFLTYAFVVRISNPRAALCASLVLGTSLAFTIMSRLMLTDVPLAAFIAGAIFSLWLAIDEPQRRDRWMIAHFLFGAGAALMKGPIALLVTTLAAATFFLFVKKANLFRCRGFLIGSVLYALIVTPWYAWMLRKFGWQFFDEFFYRDNWLRLIRAEHPANNHFWYYAGLLLLGSIPWLPFVGLTIARCFQKSARIEWRLFIWCWLLSSLVLLTIAQSKLPSYACFLFVPVAVLVGTMLDDFINRGFQSRLEKQLTFSLAALQSIALLLVPLVKTARPFATPAILVAVCTGVGLFFYKKSRFWIAATVCASGVMVISALTLVDEHVEAMSSARPVARSLMTAQKNGEPILAAKFLARGINYYLSEQAQVRVLADKAHPFWADHPLEVIVWKGNGLAAFLETNSTALCAIRNSEWRTLAHYEVFRDRDGFQQIGDNIIVRAHAISPPAPVAQP